MIVGIDPGLTSYEAADALAAALPQQLSRAGDVSGVRTATHTVQVGDPRFAVSASWDAGRPRPPAGALWEALVADLPGAGIVLTSPDEDDARASGPELAVMGAWVAVTRIARGTSGRVVHWEGHDRFAGPLTVAEAMTEGGIAAVEVIGGPAAGPGEVIDPRGFVRPRWRPAGCVLQVQRGPDGVLVPFEPAVMPR